MSKAKAGWASVKSAFYVFPLWLCRADCSSTITVPTFLARATLWQGYSPREEEKKTVPLLTRTKPRAHILENKTSAIPETKKKSKPILPLLSRYPRLVGAGDGDGVADNYPKLEENNFRGGPKQCY